MEASGNCLIEAYAPARRAAEVEAGLDRVRACGSADDVLRADERFGTAPRVTEEKTVDTISTHMSLKPELGLGHRRLWIPGLAAAALLAAVVCALHASSAFAQDTRPRFLVAVLGDSYASGEGSPDVHGQHSFGGDLPQEGDPVECRSGGPRHPCFTEKWWSPDSWFADRNAIFPQQDDTGWQAAARRCHRSTKGPGTHAAMLLADRFPGVRVEVLNFACGGSRLGETCGLFSSTSSTGACSDVEDNQGGILLPWPGPEPPDGAPILPPQLTALRDYVRNTSRAGAIDAWMVNIGGNDAEFANLLIACLDILPDFDDNCSDDGVVNRIRDHRIPDEAGDPSLSHGANLNRRYAALNVALLANANVDARPSEFYLTALPNPTHDALPSDDPAGNPADFCDGTQTNDPWYKNASRPESETIEGLLAGINGAMQRAAARHRWIFLPGMFEAWRAHGICADAASFFRTNDDGLRIQGDEGIPHPFISAGIGHPNEAGHADRALSMADLVEEQMRIRFSAPTLRLEFVEADEAFTVSWTDPTTPNHPALAENVWQIELASPSSIQTFPSSGVGALAGFTSGAANTFAWRVARAGEFQVRVRACRFGSTSSPPVRGYCGPFSNAITVATGVPGTPVDFRRTALTQADQLTSPNPIRLAWSPGPNTPSSARYGVHYGQLSGGCTGTTPSGCTVLSNSGTVSTTATTTRINLPNTGEWRFRIRACSTAGCSAFSGFLITTVSGTSAKQTSPVGTFVVRAPGRARAGRPMRVDIAWRTPRRWTDLDRIDLGLRAARTRPATIRFSQDDGVLWAITGKRRRFGHPDTRGRLKAGPFGVSLARSSIVRFGTRSRQVVLRLGIVPGRRLRGKTVTLTLSARDDQGRRQGRRLAAVFKVR